MKKTVLVHGLIAGVIVAAIMLFTMNNFSHCNGNVDYGNSMLIGYASMLLAFSLVFVGIRNYRDKYNNGVVSFGSAFKVGIMIVLIAATVYVGAWLVDYYFFIPDFMEKYAANELAQLKASGASQAKVDEQAKDTADMVRNCKNPLYMTAMTYMEILPAGLIVTLISSLILRRKAH